MTGGHTDRVTGNQCHWSTFRICTTTYMLAGGLAGTLFKKFGGKWYFLTPDYAFGHTLQAGYEAYLKKLGGTVLGTSLSPLGTTDFSSYLIKAESTHPNVLINLTDGQDRINSMKQAAQFGLFKKFAIGGGLSELEVLRATPPAAREGWTCLEWWWDQPNTPHVKEWVAAYQKSLSGRLLPERPDVVRLRRNPCARHGCCPRQVAPGSQSGSRTRRAGASARNQAAAK